MATLISCNVPLLDPFCSCEEDPSTRFTQLIKSISMREKKPIWEDLTILIPCAENEKDLAMSLSSILGQELLPKRVVCVIDNDSFFDNLKFYQEMKDASPLVSIGEGLYNFGSELYLIQSSSLGYPENMKFGLGQVDTKYIAKINENSILPTNWLSHLRGLFDLYVKKHNNHFALSSTQVMVGKTPFGYWGQTYVSFDSVFTNCFNRIGSDEEVLTIKSMEQFVRYKTPFVTKAQILHCCWITTAELLREVEFDEGTKDSVIWSDIDFFLSCEKKFDDFIAFIDTQVEVTQVNTEYVKEEPDAIEKQNQVRRYVSEKHSDLLSKKD